MQAFVRESTHIIIELHALTTIIIEKDKSTSFPYPKGNQVSLPLMVIHSCGHALHSSRCILHSFCQPLSNIEEDQINIVEGALDLG